MVTLDTLWDLACLTVLGLIAYRRSADWVLLCSLAYWLVAVLLVPTSTRASLASRLARVPHVGLFSAFARSRPLDWTEQVVLVTGSKGALGRAMCAEFERRGARVVGVDLVAKDEANPDEKEVSASSSTRKRWYYQTDITSHPAICLLADRIKQDVGTVSVLVNNAGIVHGKPVLDLEADQIRRSVDVNLLAHFYLIQAFLPGMLALGKGSIVSVSSALGLIGAPRLTDYCATKAALVGLHDSLGRELLHHYRAPSIDLYLVQPAFLRDAPLFAPVRLPTSWLFRFGAPALAPEAVARMVGERVEWGRPGEVRLPLYTNLIPLLHLSPLLREIAQWASGADAAMDHFVDDDDDDGPPTPPLPSPSS